MAKVKVAIIGAGPRGLWAAEELMEHARQRGARIDLTVFNDGPLDSASGIGAFQPTVPQQWLLNVPAHVIETRLGSFNEWRGASDPFAPRREVGRFLSQSWQALVQHVPRGCTVEVRDLKVTELVAVGDRFAVHGSLFDEVLLCTGPPHQPRRDCARGRGPGARGGAVVYGRCALRAGAGVFPRDPLGAVHGGQGLSCV